MTGINKNAPVVCIKQTTINATAEDVWKVLSDITNWPAWNSDVSFAKLNGELAPTTTFDWKTGGVGIHSTLHTVNPAKELGWTGKSMTMFAIHNWTLTSENGNATVSVEESMEGFLARLFKKALSKSLEKGMESWLVQLKQQVENQK